MTIKKFIGKTEEEATAKAKEELGPSCVIMNVRTIKPTGFLKSLKSATFEVTAAIEEKEYKVIGDAVKAQNAMQSGKINLTANEDIGSILKEMPVAPSQAPVQKAASAVAVAEPKTAPKPRPTVAQQTNFNGFEERLSNLQNMLEERLAPPKVEVSKKEIENEEPPVSKKTENIKLIKMIYNTLLENEVNEKFANNLIDEVDKSINKSVSVDMMLANVYQKMVLKFGQPSPIDIRGKKPKIIFFIGPTGVGKTTTIAKVASKLKVDSGKSIGLLTADTYRIAAEEQLRTYANILDTSLTIIYDAEELPKAVEKIKNVDVILVDTAGFSHKSTSQKEDTKRLIEALPDAYDKEVYLVLSATTKGRDLIEIANSYKEIADYKLIFTKLDETSAFGNLYNIKMHTGVAISYVTNGQNVPDDIEVFDAQTVVKKLLGGN
ncbi:MAG: flagellar biosynthesis protein FlhF [Lachnospiraceae bacterium]|nr:flagellar biosynthesis protein FlhF [Lachnospiraceae bacterium]